MYCLESLSDIHKYIFFLLFIFCTLINSGTFIEAKGWAFWGLKIPAEMRNFFSSLRLPDWVWGPPNHLNGYWGSLPGINGIGREVGHSLSTSTEVKKSISLNAFIAWTGTTLPLWWSSKNC